jgi:hypothetical protein
VNVLLVLQLGLPPLFLNRHDCLDKDFRLLIEKKASSDGKSFRRSALHDSGPRAKGMIGKSRRIDVPRFLNILLFPEGPFPLDIFRSYHYYCLEGRRGLPVLP